MTNKNFAKKQKRSKQKQIFLCQLNKKHYICITINKKMLNTTIIDRSSTKQEVHNHTQTNVEASGSIAKENKNGRFINVNKSMEAFKTVFSSLPFYIEKVQIKKSTIKNSKYGINNTFSEDYYTTHKTKVFVEVKQVLVVGSDYTLEILEISKEDISDNYNGSTDKSKYFNTPTII